MPRSPALHTVPDSILDFEASIYRESFRHFIPAFWETISGAGHLVSNWHIDFMARKLEECAKRVKEGLPRVSDYVFNVPFGSSKSSVISILFPAWVWTFFPQARFISGTHTKELALDLSVKCKGVILSEKYQQLYPHVKLVKDTEGYFINEQGGDRLTCTVGGVTPTGFHGHFVIIDDPIDPQGARSELELDTAKKFMTEIIPGRKVDKDASVTILVMQRLEYRDPTAVMMKVAEDPNVVPVDLTCLPGELSEDLSPPLEEIRKLYPEAYIFDNLLDSKRLSRRTLNGYRVTLGNAYWSQIMQKPTPPGGGMFKVQFFSNRVKASPYEARRIRYWDRAQTQDAGCYTAGVLMAKDKDGFYYVEHVVHGQWEPFQRNAIIAATALRDRVRYGPKWEPVIWIEEETGSTGKESFQRMAQQLSGYVVRSDKPTGSKDTRADPWSSACAAALIRVVDNGESRNLGKSDWDVEGFILEHCLFKPEPGKRMGGFKDQVDAAGGAYNLLSGIKTGEGMRVFTIGESRHKGLRIVVCSRDNLAQTVTQHSALLISLQDPFVEVTFDGQGESAGTSGGQVHGHLQETEGSERIGSLGERSGIFNESTNGRTEISKGEDRNVDARMLGGTESRGQLVPNPPAHGLSRCLGSLVLQFADVSPKEYQDKWDEPLQPWNKKPEDLQMSRDDGKKLWAFLLKKRDPNPDVIVIQDDGDRRALSLSYSICDVLHLPRTIIHVVANEEMVHKDKEAPNEHVYNVSKLGRSMVVG